MSGGDILGRLAHTCSALELSLLLAILIAPFVWAGVAFALPKMDHRWGRRVVGPAQPGGFRTAPASPRVEARAEPRRVRALAVMTAFLGGCLLPYAPAALFVAVLAFVSFIARGDAVDRPMTQLVWALALSIPTGVWTARECLRLYAGIIQNAHGLTRKMRRLAQVALPHHGLLVVVFAGYGWTSGERGAWWFALHPLVSLVHALLLLHAARVIDRINGEEARAALETGVA